VQVSCTALHFALDRKRYVPSMININYQLLYQLPTFNTYIEYINTFSPSPVTKRPNAGHDLILQVYRSHTTHHSRYDSSGSDQPVAQTST
jgi:hypothetical protein